MSQELVISSNPIETTVAVLEDDRLVEVYVEHHAQKAITGNIYKGRVTRVLAGMQSAFVNLGLRRDAFLYVTDVLDPSESVEEGLDDGPIPADPTRTLDIPGEPKEDEARPGEAPDHPGGPEQVDGGGSAEAPSDAVAAERSPEVPSRRRRRRRRTRRSEDGSATAETVPEDQADAQSDVPGAVEPSSSGPPEQDPVVLPGESLAKYGRHQAPTNAVGAGGAEPQTDASDAQGTESVAVDDQPVSLEPASAEAAREAPASAGTSENGSVTEEAGAPETPDPPHERASVSAPSTRSEFRFRLFGWGKGKGKAAESKPEEEPKAPDSPGAPPSKRRRSTRGRPARKTADRSAAGTREAPRKRPSRRSDGPARSHADGRAKRGAKADGRPRGESKGRDMQASPQADIKSLLRNGQEVIVQVNKEPVGQKGARITSHVSLPGRYMVYMTTAKHNGVAQKIQPESERTRLRRIIDKHSEGKPGGFVVRSAAKGASEEDLVADIEFLQELWQQLQEKAEKRKAPAMLHSDLDIVERVVRDQHGQNYKTIWVDSEQEYERILRFVERFKPELVDHVKLYTRPQPIHDSFDITKDLEKALKPKVWLKSGGYLVINQTEALVAIDVNTGRYVGKSNRLEDTVLKTNLEAAEEIVRQLRLRDLGGIIVIDFIDMEDRKNRQQVQQVLQEALRKTRTPTRLLPFNEFGLAVITRKPVRQSLERAMCVPCPSCSGTGTVKSPATVLSEIFSAADRIAASSKRKDGELAKDLTLRVHPEIAKSLKHRSNRHIATLEEVVGSSVVVRGDGSMHPDAFTLD